jgi:hypothetical protein
MHGVFLDEPVNYWFSFKTPRTMIPKNLIVRLLAAPFKSDSLRQHSRAVWLGSLPHISLYTENKKDKSREMILLTFHEKTEELELKLPKEQAIWLIDILARLTPGAPNAVLLKDLLQHFPASANQNTEDFMQSSTWKILREKGLVLV